MFWLEASEWLLVIKEEQSAKTTTDTYKNHKRRGELKEDAKDQRCRSHSSSSFAHGVLFHVSHALKQAPAHYSTGQEPPRESTTATVNK